MDMDVYFPIYDFKKNDRVFQNGPDIADFYTAPQPDAFLSLGQLDPAFRVTRDWEEEGGLL